MVAYSSSRGLWEEGEWAETEELSRKALTKYAGCGRQAHVAACGGGGPGLDEAVLSRVLVSLIILGVYFHIIVLGLP